jgi:ankyrin repeat protein
MITSLSSDIPLDTPDDSGLTAFVLAARYGHLPCLEYLADRGVNVRAAPASGSTAFHWAASQGHVHCLPLLLRLFGDVDTTSLQGSSTPLHLAAFTGQMEAVAFLMSHGASVSARTGFGRTPEGLAELGGHAEVARYLHDRAPAHSCCAVM